MLCRPQFKGSDEKLPKDGVALLGERSDTNVWKDGGAPCRHIAQVAHEGGHPVAQVAHARLLPVAHLAGGVGVVVVHAADAVVGHLQIDTKLVPHASFQVSRVPVPYLAPPAKDVTIFFLLFFLHLQHRTTVSS